VRRKSHFTKGKLYQRRRNVKSLRTTKLTTKKLLSSWINRSRCFQLKSLLQMLPAQLTYFILPSVWIDLRKVLVLESPITAQKSSLTTKLFLWESCANRDKVWHVPWNKNVYCRQKEESKKPTVNTFTNTFSNTIWWHSDNY